MIGSSKPSDDDISEDELDDLQTDTETKPAAPLLFAQQTKSEATDAPDTTDNTPINQQLSHKNILLDELEGVTRRLEKRLHPVTQQLPGNEEPSADSVVPAGPKVSDNSSTLAQTLAIQNSRTSSTIDRLHAIVRKLEI